MTITPLSLTAFASMQKMPVLRQHAVEQTGEAGSANPAVEGTRITISQAARDALTSSQNTSASESGNAIEARLAKIKATEGMSRTVEDMDFLLANDKKLAEIEAKGDANRTAADIDYVQKARGFVNTMKNLSDDEKALYDELVAKGNTAAAGAISAIAFIREMGHTAGGQNGTTYDPINSKITVEDILKLFRHSIVDPTGETESRFQALVQYLQTRQTEATAQSPTTGEARS